MNKLLQSTLFVLFLTVGMVCLGCGGASETTQPSQGDPSTDAPVDESVQDEQ